MLTRQYVYLFDLVIKLQETNLKNNPEFSAMASSSHKSRTRHHRCLGVTIDEHLTWHEHVNSTVAKVSQRIGFVKHIWRQLTKQARRLFFTAVIQPCFDYCSVVTMTQVTSKDRAKILRLLHRGVRVIVHVDSLTPVEPLFQELHLKALQEYWLFSILLFAFTVSHLKPLQPIA